MKISKRDLDKIFAEARTVTAVEPRDVMFLLDFEPHAGIIVGINREYGSYMVEYEDNSGRTRKNLIARNQVVSDPMMSS